MSPAMHSVAAYAIDFFRIPFISPKLVTSSFGCIDCTKGRTIDCEINASEV